MITSINYSLYKNGEEHIITIAPANQNIAGVFSLREGDTNMGEIVFDDHMKQWEYTGMGDLTHEEAARIAGFIQANDHPDINNDPVL